MAAGRILLKLLAATAAYAATMGMVVGGYWVFQRTYLPPHDHWYRVHLDYRDAEWPTGKVVFGTANGPRPHHEYDVLVEVGTSDALEQAPLPIAMVELADIAGQALSRRALQMAHASWAVRAARLVLFLPLHVLRWRTEARTTLVQMMEGWRPLPPGLLVRIEDVARALPITSLRVGLVVRLHGLRRWMYEWPLTTAFVVSLGLHTSLVCLLLVGAVLRRSVAGESPGLGAEHDD